MRWFLLPLLLSSCAEPDTRWLELLEFQGATDLGSEVSVTVSHCVGRFVGYSPSEAGLSATFSYELKISNETSKRIRVVTHFYFFDAHSLKIASTGDHWMTINPMAESVSKRTYEVRFPDTNALKSVTGMEITYHALPHNGAVLR